MSITYEDNAPSPGSARENGAYSLMCGLALRVWPALILAGLNTSPHVGVTGLAGSGLMSLSVPLGRAGDAYSMTRTRMMPSPVIFEASTEPAVSARMTA